MAIGIPYSISDLGTNGHHTFTLTVTENSIDVENNTSEVDWSFTLTGIGWNWEGWGTNISYSVSIGGISVVPTNYIPTYAGTSAVTLSSGTVTISHNPDGTRPMEFSFWVADSTGQSYTCGDANGSRTINLTPIPRYPDIPTNVTVTYPYSNSYTSAYIHWENGNNLTEGDYTEFYYKVNSGEYQKLNTYTTYFPNNSITLEDINKLPINAKAGDTLTFAIRAYKAASGLYSDYVYTSPITYDTRIAIKNSGIWIKAQPYAKINSEWKKIIATYVKVDGSWKRVQ